MSRITTDRMIEVIVNGIFEDSENKLKTYRIKLFMPDCIDEWIHSNIKNRYGLKSIQRGKEYKDGKEIENKEYLKASKLISINIEETDEMGNNLIKVTNKCPTFYGRSLFTFTNIEIQDFATAFGLHKVKTQGSIENLRMDAFLEYLEKIKQIDENKVKQFSFYKYDKARRKHYIEISDEEKKGFISIRGNVATLGNSKIRTKP
jgi:hypothetical protein